MQYRRANTAGGTYFFTVNLAERNADTLVRHIDDLREVTRRVKETHPFSIVAMDLARHVDYIHYNPVKHGWVTRAVEWPLHTARLHRAGSHVIGLGWGHR